MGRLRVAVLLALTLGLSGCFGGPCANATDMIILNLLALAVSVLVVVGLVRYFDK